MEAEPKSPSLTWPGSVRRILPAFTSLMRREAINTCHSNICNFNNLTPGAPTLGLIFCKIANLQSNRAVIVWNNINVS